MAAFDLSGKRVLLTQASDFMGPVRAFLLDPALPAVALLARPIDDPARPAQLVAEAGHIDILLAHLAVPAARKPAVDTSDDDWRHAFEHMVDPLPRLVRAVLPQMVERGHGKVLLMGSASPLRGMKRASTYSAARGAQLAYIQSVGVEMAPHKVQVNAIAQNFVENPTYFPPEVQADPAFKERLKWEVPLGRLVGAREDAMFAAYLCSSHADCFVGQVFPVCGGWVPR